MRTTVFLLAILLAPPIAFAVPETVTVRRGPLEVAVDAPGELRARVREEVRLDLLAGVGNPVLRRVVPAGTIVSMDDPLLRFHVRPWARARAAAEEDLAGAKLSHDLLLERHASERDSARRGLRAREEALQRARDDLRAWTEHELPVARKRDQLEAEGDAQALANERAELEQLELMYEEDELVDETEEIVLERARFSLARRVAINALNALRRDWRAEWEWPRRRESLERAVRDREGELQAARREAKIAEAARAKALGDSERAVRDKDRRLRWIDTDLETLEVTAPDGGVVLHGEIDGGFGRRYRVGQSPDLSKPVVTILDPTAPRALVRLPAREISRVEPGQSGTFTPDLAGDPSWPARVLSISHLARGGDVEVVLEVEAPDPWLHALGLSGKAHLLLKRHEDALLLPLRAVRRDGDRAFCVVGEGDESREVDLRTGDDDGTDVVILSGLSEGDAVVLPGEGK